ncbi:MAG TPA: ABC-F family ATP-binding cassette domain-containing protein [Acidimicrobiales bacterium]
MIVGSNLTVEIGDRTLLADASFVVGEGEKVGLVGRNGTGKSSFISVLVGEASPQLRHRGNVRVLGSYGYLPQAPVPGGLGLERTGFSHILSARGLDVLDDALGAARQAMAKEPSDAHIELFTDLQDKFQTSGGYEAESVMARLADGLGLREELLLEDIDELSGGQRRRVDLVRVLFQEPELMILDEPTNHLDRSAKHWLLDELARFSGAILVVSHDLKLLDHAITKVLHISNQHLTEWKGNYSKFQLQHEADQSQRERSAQLEQREIKRLSTQADSMRASSEKRARKAQAIDKRVERMEATRTQVDKRERASKFKLPVPPRSGATPLEVAKLGVRYGSNEVLTNVSFHAGRGDHIVIIGRNGAGKSSLLRCLAGVQDPTNGVVELGANVVLGYFAQEHEQIDPDLPALANVSDAILKQEKERRALLGSFGLPSKAADQLPGTLSGGERAKLGLAMLSAGEANVLLLDEPTNNLDPSSITAVGTMLGDWPGTIIAVSHERGFVEALRPTYCLRLPDERYTHWREEYLDDVEMR